MTAKKDCLTLIEEDIVEWTQKGTDISKIKIHFQNMI